MADGFGTLLGLVMKLSTFKGKNKLTQFRIHPLSL